MSEVARLRAQIELECEAALRGMSGFALVARHESITKRLADLGQQLENYERQLVPLVGREQAQAMIVETYGKVIG